MSLLYSCILLTKLPLPTMGSTGSSNDVLRAQKYLLNTIPCLHDLPTLTRIFEFNSARSAVMLEDDYRRAFHVAFEGRTRKRIMQDMRSLKDSSGGCGTENLERQCTPGISVQVVSPLRSNLWQLSTPLVAYSHDGQRIPFTYYIHPLDNLLVS